MSDTSGSGSLRLINGINSVRHTLFESHFLVLGSGITGLSTAIALRRAGHRVTVLDVKDQYEKTWGIGGCIVPPNMSKLVARWGMEEQLEKLGVRWRSLPLIQYETGDILGIHHWQEEILKDTSGDFFFMHYADLLKILRESALDYGTAFHPGPDVASIFIKEGSRPSVTLTSGEVLETDVIVAANGPEGVARAEVLEGQEVQDTHLGFTIYRMSIPKKMMAQEPVLISLVEQEKACYSWLGDRRGALGYTAGIHDTFLLQLFVPSEGTESMWGKEVDSAHMLNFAGKCAPALQRMVEIAGKAICLPLNKPAELDTWVHPSGRLVLAGDSAHKFPYGTVQSVAASVGDAACFGEFFRHLHEENQINSFLLAFENIRKERVKDILSVDLDNLHSTTMAYGEQQEARDATIRLNHEKGLDAFAGTEGDLREVWERDMVIFAYDAEEHAADWWNDWGLLQERIASYQADHSSPKSIRSHTPSTELLA